MWERLKNFKYGYLLLALVLGGVGALFISFRETTETLALVLGILLVLFAAYRLVMALADKNRSATFVVRLVVAFAVLVGGVGTIVFRAKVATLILALFALALIIDGSFKLQLTVALKTYTLPLFWVLFTLAVGVIAGAFITLYFPLSDVQANTVLLGCILILDGVSNLVSPFGIASCEKAAAKAQAQKTEANASEDV